jgi:hypothetical protein
MSSVFKGIGSLLFGGASPPPVPPMPTYQDAAALAQQQEDELRRRQGASADILTGSMGAMPAPGSIGRLIVGN